MGRTRGTERGSKPEEAPIGPEFAERTRDASTGTSDAVAAGASGPTERKKSTLSSFEKRRPSSDDPAAESSAVEPDKTVAEENRGGERRGSITNIFKKIF